MQCDASKESTCNVILPRLVPSWENLSENSQNRSIGLRIGLPVTAYRFQRSRKKGWRKPAGGIICTKQTRWGNKLFDWKELGRAEAARLNRPLDWQILGRAQAAALFKAELLEGRLSFTVEDVKRELRGKPLGCFCPLDHPCHVDVLLEIANAPD
jgi:hypothetical protein